MASSRFPKTWIAGNVLASSAESIRMNWDRFQTQVSNNKFPLDAEDTSQVAALMKINGAASVAAGIPATVAASALQEDGHLSSAVQKGEKMPDLEGLKERNTKLKEDAKHKATDILINFMKWEVIIGYNNPGHEKLVELLRLQTNLEHEKAFVNEALVNQALKEAARKANMTMDEYLEKQFTTKASKDENIVKKILVKTRKELSLKAVEQMRKIVKEFEEQSKMETNTPDWMKQQLKNAMPEYKAKPFTEWRELWLSIARTQQNSVYKPEVEWRLPRLEAFKTFMAFVVKTIAQMRTDEKLRSGYDKVKTFQNKMDKAWKTHEERVHTWVSTFMAALGQAFDESKLPAVGSVTEDQLKTLKEEAEAKKHVLTLKEQLANVKKVEKILEKATPATQQDATQQDTYVEHIRKLLGQAAFQGEMEHLLNEDKKQEKILEESGTLLRRLQAKLHISVDPHDGER